MRQNWTRARSVAAEAKVSSEVSSDVRAGDFPPTSMQAKTVDNDSQQSALYKKLERYRDKLLQIESRNRSITLRRIYDKWCFDLSKIIVRGSSLAERVTERALLGKNGVCVVADSDDSELAEKSRVKLKSLYRNITQVERETGLKDNYLGFPFLEGHIGPDTYVRAPLVLFPMSLERRENGKPPGWYASFSKDKSPILNRALLVALKKIGGYSFSESFYDEFEDLLDLADERQNLKNGDKGAGKNHDVESLFLQGLIDLLIRNNIPLKSSENRLEKIEMLEPVSSQDESTMPRQGLHLVNFKIIGNFPQGNTAIYADYEELLKKVLAGEINLGVIDDLLEAPATEDIWSEGNGDKEAESVVLDDISAMNLNIALDSDSSQDSVIVAAHNNECTVVRGPPGTGKSQVIVNLIADALAKGKKVLVVCQKRAALDVVYQRLDKVGLGKYAALLHDPVTDRQELYQQLGRLLSPTGINSVNLSSIKSRFDAVSQEIDKIVGMQRSIVDALWKEYFGGLTVHQLYTAAKPGYVPRLDLSKIAASTSYLDLPQLLEAIKNAEDSCKRFDNITHPWVHRKDFSVLGFNDKNGISEILRTLVTQLGGKEPEPLLAPSIHDQNVLLEALRVLESERGMFRKLKGRWVESHSNVKRILGVQDVRDDPLWVTRMIHRAKGGLEIWRNTENLSKYLNESGFDGINLMISTGRLADLHSRFSEMYESLADFDALQAYDARKAAMTPVQRKVLQECTMKLMSETNWADVVREEFYAHWIDYIERENPALKGQPFETYLQNRERLAKLLKEHKNLVVQRIAAQIEAGIVKPGLTPGGKRSYRAEYVQWSKLADEFDKKRHVLPVRMLIEKYESVVFNVAPCWLVSPEAASTVFPLKRNLFDFIIFDEASQSAVERSLPSLYRGGNVVIMGDEKQLRPFDLFRVRDDDESLEEELVDETMLSESLLVLAKRIYGPRYLAWHYRSKYQELIDFSNHAFYDGHLQVSPNILKVPAEPPIRWIQCGNGVWTDRKNIPEAELVIDEVKRILTDDRKNRKHQSIGIITFNESQQMAILDEIDRRRKQDPEFDELYGEAENPESNLLDDRPFVKNIENVQGDERDIIIFSVGYARDPDGNLHIRFGSLNQEGGENRLNVAVTRARKEIVVVCSIDPDELRTDAAKNSGPKRLKDYLRYAKAISENNRQSAGVILASLNNGFRRENSASGFLFESPFEEMVHDRLTQLGYTVDTQVGYSGYKIDLAVVHPDEPFRYIIAIECDGATFHSAKSTRERDVMRQEFLESRGWVVERIWSRNWWRNPRGEIERIRDRIEGLRGQSADRITKE